MPLASCPRCKKMFTKIDNPICPTCEPLEKEDQDKVRAILDENPNLNAEGLAEKADVGLAVVERMLSAGALASVGIETEQPKCGRCGAPAISLSKRLCQACLEKLNVEVAQMQRQIQLNAKPEAKIGSYDNKLNVLHSLDAKREGRG